MGSWSGTGYDATGRTLVLIYSYYKPRSAAFRGFLLKVGVAGNE